MSQAPVLTGQDIAEAEGALTRLLEQSLAATNTSRVEYIALRVLVVRGPFTSPDELHDYLAGQPQLGLTQEATAGLLAGLQEQGLAAGTALGSPGPAKATERGAARLAELADAVAPTTRKLFGGLDPDELAIAHRVLEQIITRAGELIAQT
jgi:hypothetical protein